MQDFNTVDGFSSLFLILFLNQNLHFILMNLWFTLHGYVNSQDSRYWSTENPHAVHEVPVCDTKECCTISARRITGLILFMKQIMNIMKYYF
jgi:hypothetical protein